ncbi:MAG: class I SAM-dependent methyltransferase [Candidatus Shapirobacteria bacterium]|nr:class I SAM-dependent methyltransferase [Candidatus Shapirobacteria bacterium]
MHEIRFSPSDIAFFHNQKTETENRLTDFNSSYAANSPEVELPYSSETISTAFQPLLEILQSKIPSINQARILEIGGSSGLLSKYLQDQGANVTMVEIQSIFVDQAKKRGIDARRYNGSSLTSVIDRSDNFDVIIANRVFEDIVMDEYSAKVLIKQSSLFLKPQGFLLIGSQNPLAIWDYAFLKNGFNITDTKQSNFNPYIKEVRVYQQ